MVSIVRAATCGRALSCSWWLSFTLPSPMFSIPDNSRTVIHLFSRMSVLACYGSPRPALHSPPRPFFKRTAPLTDTNIWQLLLTILPPQSWTDFWRFTAIFVRNLIIMRCSTLTCTFASLIFLTTDKIAQQQTTGRWMPLEQYFHLPHITTFNGPRCIFELRTNYNSYLPAPCIW